MSSAQSGRRRPVVWIVVTLVVIVGIAACATFYLSDRSEHLVPGTVGVGRNAPLGGKRVFPADNPWNARVDMLPLDPHSADFVRRMGAERPLHADFGPSRSGLQLYGIPYVVVGGSVTRKYHVQFENAEESDTAAYPIPLHPPVESGGDHHLLILDRDSWQLYELYRAAVDKDGGWKAASGAIFDLASNRTRPQGWTSADAAGLPILPGLARADEVYDLKEIMHALRFTTPRTQHAARYPALHYASANRDSLLPPMGLRLRLKRDIDPMGFPEGARVIVRALQRYGMILADNGSPWYITGTADRRWTRRDLNALNRIHGSDFEVVVSPAGGRVDTTRSVPND